MRTPTKLGANVKEILRRKGLKQNFIAEKTGITSSQLSTLVRNRKTIDSSLVLPLCTALEVSPNELFGYEEQQQ